MTLDLEALKKSLMHGPLTKAECAALVDELTETRRREDRAAARAGQWMVQNEALIRAKREAEAALANARAVMAEEAARWVDKRAAHISSGFEGAVADADEHRAWTAAKIRALAPLDPSLLVVEREVVEAVKAALKSGIHVLHWEVPPGDPPLLRAADALRAALTRLEGKP